MADRERQLSGPAASRSTQSAAAWGAHFATRFGTARIALWVLAAVAACLCGGARPSAASADGIWSEEQPPLAREGHAAIYDPVRDRMLVFGGGVAGFNGIVGDDFNDLWTVSLAGDTTWTRLAPAGTPPSARARHSAIYDPVRDRVIVFGGDTGGGTGQGDVWTLSLAGPPTWTQLSPVGTPPIGRMGHTAIYDPVRDRMLIFGGSAFVVTDSTAGIQYFHDVWALSLAGTPTWTELAPAGTPPGPRNGHSAIYDPVRDRMVMFGGVAGDHLALNDTWALSLAGAPAWTELAPSGTPPAWRAQHTAIYDPVRDQMLVFGGIHGLGDFLNPFESYSDVQALSLAGGTAWMPFGITPPDLGLQRFGSSAVYDPVRDRMVIFGGAFMQGASLSIVVGNYNDAWMVLLASGPEWARLTPGDAPPPARLGSSAILDPLRDRMLVFGGVAQSGPGTTDLADASARSLGNRPAWAPDFLPTGTPPSARDGHTAIYDPVRDRMLVFGGEPGSGSFPRNDLWGLSLAGSPAWTALTPAGTPPSARVGHTAVYDPVRDRMLVFGGSPGLGPSLGDVWELSLATNPTWTQLSPSGTPPGSRFGHTAIYDPMRDRMIVFGGAGDGGYDNDVWALSLAGSPTWTQLAPSGTPPSAREFHTAIYDPVRDRMVVFGGDTAGGGPQGDAWALSLSNSPAWTLLTPPGPPPGPRSHHNAIYDVARDRMVVFGGSTSRSDVWDLAWTEPLSVLPGVASLQLAPAYPNPARRDVAIAFTMPHASPATLRIYDVSGRLARTLVDGPLPAGPQSVRWDGRLATGAPASPGLYFYELRVDGKELARRLALTP